MSTSTDTPSWPWIVLRNALTLGYCVVGAGLLWSVTVSGVPLAAIAWIGVVATMQILLTRSQSQPWLGLSALVRSGPQGSGAMDRKTSRDSGLSSYLMIVDDILPMVLMCWALLEGAIHSKGLVHYVLVGCLVILIGCSSFVKSRVNHDVIPDDHGESERRS